MKPKATTLFYPLFFLFCSAFQASSQQQHISPLFASDEMLHISLAFSMDSLMADRVQDARYFPARLSFQSGFTSYDVELKIKTRGNFRLNPNNCDFPPIMLNFSKKEVQRSLFRGQDKVKLVTHCKDESYVLKEYLAYKMYNLVSPHSFQVRLAKITYLDVERQHKPFTRYAFLLEHKKELARRLDANVLTLEDGEVSEKETDMGATCRLYLFQYLLGNQDWDITLQKNIKLMAMPDSSFVPVPYDFDFTGWVDASYTLVHMGDLARKFEYRLARFFCQEEETWQQEFERFRAQKDTMLAMIETFPHLKSKSKKDLIRYVNSFFESLDEGESIKAFFGNCE